MVMVMVKVLVRFQRKLVMWEPETIMRVRHRDFMTYTDWIPVDQRMLKRHFHCSHRSSRRVRHHYRFHYRMCNVRNVVAILVGRCRREDPPFVMLELPSESPDQLGLRVKVSRGHAHACAQHRDLKYTTKFHCHCHFTEHTAFLRYSLL